MGKLRYVALAATAAAAAASVSVAHASLNVSFWTGTSCGGDATVSCESSLGAPTGTFVIPGTAGVLSFSTGNSSITTVASWLSSGGVTYGASGSGDVVNNSLWDFSGIAHVTTGETFSITHDDGVSLLINGLALSGLTSGGTSPTTETATYSGPPGNFPVQLIYGECCGGPAVLNATVGTIPEASTWAMMLLGLAGLGYAGFRRHKPAISIA